MKQSLLQEKYPVYTLELNKGETKYRDTDEIISYLKSCIESHKVTCYTHHVMVLGVKCAPYSFCGKAQ